MGICCGSWWTWRCLLRVINLYYLLVRYPWFDPVGGIAVGLLIAKTGIDLLSGNYYNLMDRQDLQENEKMIADCMIYEII